MLRTLPIVFGHVVLERRAIFKSAGGTEAEPALSGPADFTVERSLPHVSRIAAALLLARMNDPDGRGRSRPSLEAWLAREGRSVLGQ